MALADKRQQENITEDEGKKRTEGKERSKNWEKQTTFRTTNQKTETKPKFLRSRMRLIEMDHFWEEKRRQKIEGSLTFDTRKTRDQWQQWRFWVVPPAHQRAMR